MKMGKSMLLGPVALLLGMAVLTNSHGAVGGADKVIDQVQEIARLIEKGDAAAATKLAEKAVKSIELEDMMHLMTLRKPNAKKPAFGVGDKPKSISPDGIEAKMNNMAKKAMVKATLEKEAQALMAMGYHTAAIAELARAKAPAKDEGMKKKKDWITWSDEMRVAAEEFAKAAKAKSPGELLAATKKLNASCLNCHGVFRE